MTQALKIIAALNLALGALALPVRAEPAQAVVAPLTPPAAAAAPACAPEPLWDGILGKNPQDIESLVNRGQAYAAKSEFDCAIADFSAVLALSPPDDTAKAPVLARRAAAYAAKDRTDAALADLTEAIRLTPDKAEPFYTRGTLRAKTKDFSGAIDDFTEALTLDPQNAQTLLGRGKAYADAGQTLPAIADFNHALEIDPNLALANYNLGLIYVNGGDRTQALACFSRAIDIEPGLLAARIGRGNIYLANGQLDLAIADYTSAVAADASAAPAYAGRGSAYRALGDLTRATTDLERAIMLDPKDTGSFYNLGLTRYFSKKYGNALKAFARSADLTADPNAKFYPAFWAYLAKAKLGFNGKTVFTRATAQMDPAIWPAPLAAMFQGNLPPSDLPARIPATDPGKQAGLTCEAYFYQGEWYLMNGQQDQATAAFKTALATGEVHRAEYEAAAIELRALGETVD